MTILVQDGLESGGHRALATCAEPWEPWEGGDQTISQSHPRCTGKRSGLPVDPNPRHCSPLTCEPKHTSPLAQHALLVGALHRGLVPANIGGAADVSCAERRCSHGLWAHLPSRWRPACVYMGPSDGLDMGRHGRMGLTVSIHPRRVGPGAMRATAGLSTHHKLRLLHEIGIWWRDLGHSTSHWKLHIPMSEFETSRMRIGGAARARPRF